MLFRLSCATNTINYLGQDELAVIKLTIGTTKTIKHAGTNTHTEDQTGQNSAKTRQKLGYVSACLNLITLIRLTVLLL